MMEKSNLNVDGAQVPSFGGFALLQTETYPWICNWPAIEFSAEYELCAAS